MKKWCRIREAKGLNHRGQKLGQDKLVYLTEQQLKLINATVEKVVEIEPPNNPDNVAVLADWDDYQKTAKSVDFSGLEDKPTKENFAKKGSRNK